MRHLLLAVLVAPVLAHADQVVLTMNDPFSVTCDNPTKPSLREGAPGGLDEGLLGDTDNLLLGAHDVGKQWYGSNDACTVHFRAEGALTIEVGVWLSQFGCPEAAALLDGVELGRFSAQGSPDGPTSHSFSTNGTGQVQTLTIRPLTGNGYVHVDALRLTAPGDVEVTDAEGRGVLMPSTAVPPSEAASLAERMKTAPNLALVGEAMTYAASEEFATGIDGSRAYSAQIALDGDPDNEYWAGGTPPPHALILAWKQPVTLDTNRILWLGENRGLWYGLEYWDGVRWRLLYEERRNLQPEPIYRFAPVTTTRVRFTIYSVLGQQRVLMRAFELYSLGESGGGDQ
ncbi:MAG: hypothetical protein HPY69_04765 [Armatimonadetes bacterium]|nr:hypothetical protein [Armatimonadota bacterium]